MGDKHTNPILPAGFPAYSEKHSMREVNESVKRDGVAVIGISRHRLGTDGRGITTLVAFHGCPLRCKYCLMS